MNNSLVSVMFTDYNLNNLSDMTLDDNLSKLFNTSNIYLLKLLHNTIAITQFTRAEYYLFVNLI
ncbi:hypothetical protein D3C85_1854570 [compost metagenome]